ncbi:MAG: hypothetical protein B6D63_03985 [Candidatus Latescibacteria bacterium 4484_7]|nr:MAG: hypothetical protein B6D63_03985 [Candidatus Latescibacteria bacterium 4484_7]RKZ05463.1 MAG: hypothetical protein DRQ05_06385 [bacterium]
MRSITIAVLVIPFILIILGCASVGGPKEASHTASKPVQTGDSASIKALSKTFFDMHIELLEEINDRLEKNASDPAAIEADAIVKTAESLYLEGNIETAIEVLSEAKKILGQAN